MSLNVISKLVCDRCGKEQLLTYEEKENRAKEQLALKIDFVGIRYCSYTDLCDRCHKTVSKLLTKILGNKNLGPKKIKKQ